MIARTLTMASLCGWLLSSMAVADHYPEVMFILDSSGSMAEVVAGKSKLDTAKEVMHQVVPELDDNVRVGLTAYGHRRLGDCSDIEVLNVCRVIGICYAKFWTGDRSQFGDGDDCQRRHS
jgi:hypothetical protein